WGRWPITALSTSATSGTERLDRIIGAASAQTRRWVGACRQAANSRDIAGLQNSRPLYRSLGLGVGRSRYGNASIKALEAGKPDEMLGWYADPGCFQWMSQLKSHSPSN